MAPILDSQDFLYQMAINDKFLMFKIAPGQVAPFRSVDPLSDSPQQHYSKSDGSHWIFPLLDAAPFKTGFR